MAAVLVSSCGLGARRDRHRRWRGRGLRGGLQLGALGVAGAGEQRVIGIRGAGDAGLARLAAGLLGGAALRFAFGVVSFVSELSAVVDIVILVNVTFAAAMPWTSSV